MTAFRGIVAIISLVLVLNVVTLSRAEDLPVLKTEDLGSAEDLPVLEDKDWLPLFSAAWMFLDEGTAAQIPLNGLKEVFATHEVPENLNVVKAITEDLMKIAQQEGCDKIKGYAEMDVLKFIRMPDFFSDLHKKKDKFKSSCTKQVLQELINKHGVTVSQHADVLKLAKILDDRVAGKSDTMQSPGKRNFSELGKHHELVIEAIIEFLRSRKADADGKDKKESLASFYQRNIIDSCKPMLKVTQRARNLFKYLDQRTLSPGIQEINQGDICQYISDNTEIIQRELGEMEELHFFEDDKNGCFDWLFDKCKSN